MGVVRHDAEVISLRIGFVPAPTRGQDLTAHRIALAAFGGATEWISVDHRAGQHAGGSTRSAEHCYR